MLSWRLRIPLPAAPQGFLPVLAQGLQQHGLTIGRANEQYNKLLNVPQRYQVYLHSTELQYQQS